MGEHLGDVLYRLSGVLHWLGKYEEANAVALTARLVRGRGLRDLDEYEAFIAGFEEDGDE